RPTSHHHSFPTRRSSDLTSNHNFNSLRRKIMNPVVHFEMPAEDRNRMAKFYTKAFGWQTEMLGPEMNEYVLVTTTEPGENGRPKDPGANNGGFYKKSAD